MIEAYFFLAWSFLAVMAHGSDLSGDSAVASKGSTSHLSSRVSLDLGSVKINAQERSVTCTGYVNQVEGPIELLACTPEGKLHESVFVLNAHPADLHAGLLLVGLKPGQPPRGLGQGPVVGPGVDIWVEWEWDGSRRSERAERFIYHAKERTPLPPLAWVFTGSMVDETGFKASAEGSLVATYWDPWAILNIPLACGGNDELLVVNRCACPPLRTPVVIRFKAAASTAE